MPPSIRDIEIPAAKQCAASFGGGISKFLGRLSVGRSRCAEDPVAMRSHQNMTSPLERGTLP